MIICLPVDRLNGLDSKIFANFRSAPALLVVDTDHGDCLGIDATEGTCGAVPHQINSIICAGGMGRGMFNGLRQQGISVFNTTAITVADALTELKNGRLEKVTEVACCGEHHNHDEGNCEHHHQEGEHGGCCH